MLAALAGLVALQFAPARAAPPTALTEASVRALVARQEAAWNARDAAGYFALFAPEAAFVEQGRSNLGGLVRYGSSRRDEARRHAERFFSGPRTVDRTIVDRVVISPDRRSAEVTGRKVTTLVGKDRPHCAEVRQSVRLAGGRILSFGETSTAVRCRDAGASGRPAN